jgi:hypothetical protein
MHNFAKIFLFRMDKMMIHPDFVVTVIYRCSGHNVNEHRDVTISLVKLYEIRLYIEYLA